ncbi:hypothetical protein HPB49_023619 [Dermacentor silvarum]|uniref:Uncharacterized protein n=1 Tax=Dermacentor silvarum TaxID=543639 RepID=A0ACB8DL01_DERSI|nr:hypothetical protein HPB49_023619 [Dermacentor silvarum]
MSASFPVVPARWLAAALLVCSLVALTQPGSCAARNLHKRSFLELGCRGNFEQSYLARLERVCEECYQLYREPQVYNLCSFFSLPKSVENQGERTKALSTKRRSLWLARIKRANLDTENRNLRVCGAHFTAGKPAKLFDETDPDWAPSLLLGYSAMNTDPSRHQRLQKTTRRKAASGRRKAGSRIAGTACRGRRGGDRDSAVCRSAPLAAPDWRNRR